MGRLQQANALIVLTTSSFAILGPAVGGVLVATVGPGGRWRSTPERS
jgi:hypothetical protein